MLMEQVRTKSFPLRQRRGPAAPVEDMFSSPDQKFFHIPTTNYSNLGMKTENHGPFPPRTVWKSQSHGLVADWLGFMEPAHGESCPSGQRRRPTAPGEDEFPSPDQKILPYLYNSNKPVTTKRIPQVDTAPQGVDTPTPLVAC